MIFVLAAQYMRMARGKDEPWSKAVTFDRGSNG